MFTRCGIPSGKMILNFGLLSVIEVIVKKHATLFLDKGQTNKPLEPFFFLWYL